MQPCLMLAEKSLQQSFFMRKGAREQQFLIFFGLDKVFLLRLMHRFHLLVNLHPEKNNSLPIHISVMANVHSFNLIMMMV